MTDVFMCDNRGFLTDTFRPDSEWLLTEKFIAYRLYDGLRMRLTSEGWQHWNGRSFEATYPVVPVKNLLRSLFKRELLTIDSSFEYIEEFESAKLVGSTKYDLGDYTLHRQEEWLLVSPNGAEQMGNIQMLELKEDAAFTQLQDTFAPMRDSVYAVEFVSTESDRKAVIYTNDFDWANYEATE